VTCREAEELLGAYLDEELDLSRSLDVEAHARECAACAARLRRMEAAREAVGSKAPYYAAPAELRQRIERRAAQHFGVDEKRSESRLWSGRWMALAAMCAAMALFVWRVVPLPRAGGADDIAREVVDGHVRSLLANHLMDVPSSDRHAVKPWFAGKLDFAPEVKDLASDGFTLVGGRLDYLHGRTVAAIVYRRRQHTINLFVWPAHEGDRGLRAETRDGFHVLSWVRGGMNWWAVSDLNAEELAELARLL
jgi:anti-sigma factor RsiW